MNETILYNFSGPDGSYPTYGLIRDASGNLYGITYTGGNYYGTVFELSPPSGGTGPWTEKVLHSFNQTDGQYPTCLIRDTKGNLYGTTTYGGSSLSGTVFELVYKAKTKTYSFKLLYQFTGGTDGGNPLGLIMNKQRNLLGTASSGGALGYGDVWEISPAGFQVLYSPTSGGYLGGDLALDASGNLYFDSADGGDYGEGAIFELSASGSERVIHSFDLAQEGGDGEFPGGSLVISGKYLYGTTQNGGEGSDGVIYKLSTTTGVDEVLYSFPGYAYDGYAPNGLILVKGNLYGTDWSGGTYGGTVFESTKGVDAETTLYTFQGPPGDGAYPTGKLVMDTKTGILYGITGSGGANNIGTVFELTP